MSRSNFVWLILIAIAGLVIGSHVRSSFPPRSTALLEPRLVEIAVDPFQFQTVVVHLQLSNNTSKKTRVLDVDTSCHCTSIVYRGGEKFVTPIELKPGESMPWQVAVETQGRLGPQSFSVFLKTDTDGRVTKHKSTIEMDVQTAYAVKPTFVRFEMLSCNEDVTQRIDVMDGYPDPGFEIKDVEVSNPEQMSVEVFRHESETNEQTIHAKSDIEPARSLKSRYHLKLKYRAPATPLEAVEYESLVLVPADNSMPKMKIPIQCRMKPADFQVLPARLTVLPEALGKRIERTVLCRSLSESVALKILDEPTFTTTELVEIDSQATEIRVSLDLRDLAELPADLEIRVGRDEGESPVFTIPIELLDLP